MPEYQLLQLKKRMATASVPQQSERTKWRFGFLRSSAIFCGKLMLKCCMPVAFIKYNCNHPNHPRLFLPIFVRATMPPGPCTEWPKFCFMPVPKVAGIAVAKTSGIANTFFISVKSACNALYFLFKSPHCETGRRLKCSY